MLHLGCMETLDGLLCSPCVTVAARVAYANELMSRLRLRLDRLALSTRACVERAGEVDARAHALFADIARVQCEIFVASMH